MEINFCVLPNLKIKRAFKFADYSFWSDTDQNWKKYFDCKRPSVLLDIYKDKEGNVIPEKTIVSFDDKTKASKVPQLVASLYFVRALRAFDPPSAEDFFFETYVVRDPESDSHTRISKFVRSLVLSDSYKVYQFENARKIQYELENRDKLYFLKLREIFNNPEKQNIVYSLYFFYRTQYHDESLFPQIEDIQNFSTAFEILFSIDERNNTGEAIAKSLCGHFSDSDDREKKELEDWCVKFYGLRGKYTHGKPLDPALLYYKNQRHIDIAKKIFMSSVKKFLKPGSNGREAFAFHDGREMLIALFSSQESCDDVIQLLTPHFGESSSGEKNFESMQSMDSDNLDKMNHSFMGFYLYANKEIVEYNSATKIKRLREALQNILCIVEFLVKEYVDNPEEKRISYTEALETLKEINFHSKDDENLSTIANVFNTKRLNCSEPIIDLEDLSSIRFEVRFKKRIELSILMSVFLELHSIYRNAVRPK